MTATLGEQHREQATQDAKAADTEALFKEARRRRRRRRVAAMAAALVVVGTGLAIGVAVRGSHGGNQNVAPGTTAPHRVVVAAPIPSFYVRHSPTATGAPGSIDVVETLTGKVLRSLGTEYDPYPENGFVLSANRSTLFYVHLDEPAQKVETLAVPVTGGVPKVVALGPGSLQFSPDGSKASFAVAGQTVSIVDLTTGGTTSVPLPTSNAADRVVSSSWLPDSRRLVVTIQAPDLTARCFAPPGRACSSPSPPAPAVAFRLDTTRSEWSSLPRPRELARGWNGLALQGPGQAAGTVLATVQGAAGNSTLFTLRVRDGRVLSRHAVPLGTTFLARDRSGTHVLVSDEGNTKLWLPNPGTVTVVGPAASEATW